MEATSFLRSSVLAASLCGLLFTASSCVNRIDVPETDAGDARIPIRFTSRIGNVQTKVADNAFEEGDRMGLFAMPEQVPMTEGRYIDNLMLTCTGGSGLMPEETVFYPQGGGTLDFTAYHPYAPEGVAAGTSVLPVTVQTDQETAEGRSLSDFLVASKAGVAGSDNAVELEFEHRLSKLKIFLVPSGGAESLEGMLADNPRVWATGFYTQAAYDFADGTFDDFSAVGDIAAGGEWQEADGRLEGHELIVLPQEMDGTQGLQLEWNGTIYTCAFPELERMESNMMYELVMNVNEDESHVLTGFLASIKAWGEGEELDEAEAGTESGMLHLAALDFEESNVYRVFQDGKAVAEICKEFLIASDWQSQAITVYAMDASGATDWSSGRVLQILDNDEDTNGGTLEWDEADNTFDYTPGDRPDIQNLYFDADGQASVEVPDDPAAFYVSAYKIRDLRGGKLQEYPVVKIGTQYWMRDNLNTGWYRNGEAIGQPETLDGTPGCYHDEASDLYFYNGEALEAGEVSPAGWRLPSEDDWRKLEAYVGGHATYLKAGTWRSFTDGSALETPADANKAMMYIYGSGRWDNNQEGMSYCTGPTQVVGFWSWDYESDKVAEETLFFTGGNNAISWDKTTATGKTYRKGLCVRCIQE